MRLDRIAPQPDPVWGRLVLESGKRPGGRNGEFLSCNEIWRSPGDGGTDVGRRVNAVAGANRHRIFEEVAFIVGGGGGSGVLIYQGHRYPLRVSGIGIGSIGIAEAKMSGIAYNLHRPSDITGTYSAAGAGLAVVGGGQVAQLQNEHGVLLKLQGVQLGFQATLGVGGMTISMR